MFLSTTECYTESNLIGEDHQVGSDLDLAPNKYFLALT